MILSDFAVNNRTTVFFMTVLIVLAGVYSYMTLPLESAPDIPIPKVFVTTIHSGVSPEDVEKGITIPIEKKLKGLSGIKKVVSVSSEGMSQINIEFVTGIDIDDALIKVKDKVDLAKPELPADLEDDPSVNEVNFSDMPILVLSLSGNCGMRQLTSLAEDLQDDIEGIRGVLEVEVAGKVEREIQIQVDPDRLALYGISPSYIRGIVAGENSNVSGGSIKTRDGRYQLRIPGEISSIEEFQSIIVSTHKGKPVYLRDISVIVDGLKDKESLSRINGKPSVTLSVKKRSGENIIVIADAVDEIIERSKKSKWPQGVTIYKMMNEAKKIRSMLADLENNILSGLVLVVLVVMFAMGFRNALLVSLSIPLSMLITFVVLKGLGITLNMVVLFSLTLALGMLVDNAIVIIENIYRYMQQGVGRLEAAKKATSEVAWPIIGSALTTIGAFLPLLWWDGIMGGFMVFIPKTVIITLVSCLFVALVINPALAAVMMKAKIIAPPGTGNLVEIPSTQGGAKVIVLYRRALRFVLNYRIAVLFSAAGITVIMAMLWMLRVGPTNLQEFFPAIDPTNSFVNMSMPEGAGLNYADTVVQDVAVRLYDKKAGTADELSGKQKMISYKDASVLKEHEFLTTDKKFYTPSYFDNIEFVYEKSSSRPGGANAFGGGSSNQVGIQFVDIAERKEKSKVTLQEIEKLMRNVAGADVLVEEQKEGPPTGAPINIEFTGTNLKILGKIVTSVSKVIKGLEFSRNVRDDFREGAPTIRVAVDRKRASLVGLSTSIVGNAIRTAINGTIVSDYREDDEDYDITVRFNDDNRNLIETLSRVYIPSPTHGLVPLTTLSSIEYTGGVGSIKRVNHFRTATVMADIDTTMVSGPGAREKAEELMAAGEMQMPPGFSYKFTGENEEEQNAKSFLSVAMLVALMLILFILVAQFNSIVYPAIIMSAVLLSFAGVFLGLGVCNMRFGVIMTGVGVISLAGVVVNNAIVLVDYIRLLIDRGMEPSAAIVAAGATRFRPVILTAMTTILGLIPMATGVSFDFHTFSIQWISESSQWWGSMAVAVIFGLGLATLLTLFVVPVLFSLSYAVQSRIKKLV